MTFTKKKPQQKNITVIGTTTELSASSAQFHVEEELRVQPTDVTPAC